MALLLPLFFTTKIKSKMKSTSSSFILYPKICMVQRKHENASFFMSKILLKYTYAHLMGKNFIDINPL